MDFVARRIAVAVLIAALLAIAAALPFILRGDSRDSAQAAICWNRTNGSSVCVNIEPM